MREAAYVRLQRTRRPEASTTIASPCSFTLTSATRARFTIVERWILTNAAGSVEAGHLHIEEHQVWAEPFDGIQRRVPVLALADDVDSRLQLQQRAKASSRDRLVVRDQRA
ncbi:MAG TPA: hypothetical protein VH138_04175 [Vicinamibacterales bacterium]|nr:hypothetical protein [Vicinamibacterales bacterium]